MILQRKLLIQLVFPSVISWDTYTIGIELKIQNILILTLLTATIENPPLGRILTI